MLSSGISHISRSVHELKEGIRVTGALPVAQALAIARCVEESSYPWVILCPDEDFALELISDLKTLSTLVFGKSQLPLFLPSWEQSPYSPIAPSIRTRLSRLAVFHKIAHESPRLIITTLAAAAQATLPKEVFHKNSISLRLHESIESRETLTQRLLAAGYLRVDTVEDQGSFAVRGEIVDIYPPQLENPLRIELFDNEVERIRFFDSSTQRTLSQEFPISEWRIPPAREVLINPDTTTLLRERLKQRADDQGVSRAVRDPIMASVQNGSYPDHCDAWAPFAYEKASNLWDYLPADTQVIWMDELSCLQNWETALNEQSRLAEDAAEARLILPPVEQLFAWNQKIEAKIQGQSKLFFDRFELADLEKVGTNEAEDLKLEPSEQKQSPAIHHRLSMRANTDLAQASRQNLSDLEPKFRLWLKQWFRVVALASTQSQLERLRYLLEERHFVCSLEGELKPSLISLRLGTVSQGFRWPAEGLVVLTEEDLLGTRVVRKKKKAAQPSSGSAAKEWSGLQALADLTLGDAVVHVDHGIGRYQGLVRLDLSGAPSDFLLLEYANRDKLYLPVYRLNVIQKYIGAGECVTLDKLGSLLFSKTKEKVRDAVRKLAIDLVQLYAQRKIKPGFRFSPPDSSFHEFEAGFPFDETPDQLKAVEDILRDFESGRVMDRLVCGDVGYGKTEVALRAAFKAVTDGKQVAVLVPTTVLAFQHEQSFRLRFKDYPIHVESISRFRSAKEQKAVLHALETGRVDIIIGTHRLLSRDVRFRDLGLVIVDEEHRFGVEHKERLKTLKVNTHVLTLTATPIPRTLHMALSGLRDISLINTPPVDRLPIRTFVSKYDEPLIQKAIQFELSRGGQVFVLHNRVQTIYDLANRLTALVPDARVSVGHGQMAEGELEKTMLDFYQKKTNVLVSTTIIESGLDVPSANTIIINRADTLGLAQLYQIRGRVGRGQQRAYAYLLIPNEGAVTEDAKRRLEVIQKFVELGSGFSIASHDLEIRGGGDLLGPQQSGNINAVGFDLYTELLEEAIHELEGKPDPDESSREPEIKAPFPAFLSEDYVPDIHQRLSLYRRFSAAKQESEVQSLEEELHDRFGPLPLEGLNLMWLIRIKILLKRGGIDALTVGPEKVSLMPGPKSRLNPSRAIALVSSMPDQYQILPDSKFVAKISTVTLRDLLFALESLLRDLGIA